MPLHHRVIRRGNCCQFLPFSVHHTSSCAVVCCIHYSASVVVPAITAMAACWPPSRHGTARHGIQKNRSSHHRASQNCEHTSAAGTDGAIQSPIDSQRANSGSDRRQLTARGSAVGKQDPRPTAPAGRSGTSLSRQTSGEGRKTPVRWLRNEHVHTDAVLTSVHHKQTLLLLTGRQKLG